MSHITISVPITAEQAHFIKERVKSGVSANKAHAVRQALDVLKEEEIMASLERSKADVRAGRIYYGDLDKLVKKLKHA